MEEARFSSRVEDRPRKESADGGGEKKMAWSVPTNLKVDVRYKQ